MSPFASVPLNDLLWGSGTAKRMLVGIAGPPGSGKSTLATQWWEIAERQRPGQAVIVPMDGYHLDNTVLQDRGILHLKGIPASFDAWGFVNLLKTIHRASLAPKAPAIPVPAFDRRIESTVPGAIQVAPSHRLILVEGNYLLLDTEPWHRIRALCATIVYLDVPEHILYPRLVARHMAGGKNRAGAEQKVNSTDLPNARLVMQARNRADHVLAWQPEEM